MSLRVLISDVGAARHGARIAAAVPGAVLVPVAPEGPLPETRGIEISFITRDLFVGGTRQKLNDRFLRFIDLLRAAPDLRWVQAFSAGTDAPYYQEMLARGLTLTNAAGASSTAVAQTAVTALLALARLFPRVMRQQREKRWESLYLGEEPRDVDGQTALVLGTGPIGQEIGRLCRAFGLRTIGIRRDPEAGIPPGFDAVGGYGDLPALLPRTDWLLLACPMTETTRGLVNASLLARLPPGRHLIDVSRGGIAVGEDVAAALASGHLAGAFLDVFAVEPLPADSPFWDMPNVIVSPHSAAASDGLPERVAAIFADNLARWARGEPLQNVVGPAGTA